MTTDARAQTDGPRSKRQGILDAAIDNFGGVGFEHTKWATIASQVGIGQTALYHYFESKVHCLLTIMSIELERSLQRARAAVDGLDDPDKALRAAASSAFMVTAREALQARILLSHQDLLIAPRPSEREEDERRRARELVREIEREWARILHRGVDTGVFAEREVNVEVRLVLGLVNSVWRWYRPNGPRTLQEISDVVVEACARLVHQQIASDPVSPERSPHPSPAQGETMSQAAQLTREDIRVDVGEVSAEGPFALAARLVFNPEAADVANPVILVCWPGGSYDRRYWDLQPRAASGYSAAEHWANSGYIVVAAEQLGVGESDKPRDGDSLRIAAMAEAADRLVAAVRAKTMDGSLHPSLPAMDGARFIGVGHSLGGSLVIAQQARYESYDAIVALGITQGAKAAVEIPADADRSDPGNVARAQASAFFGGKDEPYGRPLKAGSESWLYGPNDDHAVVAEDLENLPVWPRGPYVEALLPSGTSTFAAEVQHPVFLSFSEIDIPENPRAEPSYFGSADDITLFLLSNAAHCSNFSPGRVRLWDRISAWEQSLR